MSRRSWFTALLCASLVAGVGCAQFAVRSAWCREMIGRALGRGDLLALACGTGIYRNDLSSDSAEALRSAIVAANARRAGRDEVVASAEIEKTATLLRAQFADEQFFERELRASGLTRESVREAIAEDARAFQWIQKKIRPGEASEAECRRPYDEDRSRFLLPARWHARHLFLAAPAGSQSELVEEKRRQIEVLAKRLGRDAEFAQLVAETSEDEATKNRGGDLGFFASSRMPAEFIAGIAKLRPGEVSKPLQSHLGFHLVQMFDVQPSRELSFEEARTEIGLALANADRAARALRLSHELERAEIRRPRL